MGHVKKTYSSKNGEGLFKKVGEERETAALKKGGASTGKRANDSVVERKEKYRVRRKFLARFLICPKKLGTLKSGGVL